MIADIVDHLKPRLQRFDGSCLHDVVGRAKTVENGSGFRASTPAIVSNRSAAQKA
jgi:hypothetical protein